MSLNVFVRYDVDASVCETSSFKKECVSLSMHAGDAEMSDATSNLQNSEERGLLIQRA